MRAKTTRKPRILKADRPAKTREELLKEFDAASACTLFTQETVAAIRDCSVYTIERDRWAGSGVPFLKIGRQVRYRKKNILEWLSNINVQRSTSKIKL